jgi:hypothetical protein
MSSFGPAEISIRELAWLSAQVYFDSSAPNGWRRIASDGAGNEQGGFYGAAYQKAGYVVVAFRGTSDRSDAWHDSFMAPNIEPAQAKGAMLGLMDAYGVPKGHSGAMNAAQAMHNVFSQARFGNVVPLYQTLPARQFVRRVREICATEKLILRCFTGHSLGGAIAQYAAENTGTGGACQIPVCIPAVAFNSPNMGSMRNMRKGNGGGIVIVNARLDPLSLATRLAGNCSHATSSRHEFSLDTEPYGVKPPSLPSTPTQDQFVSFLSWLGAAAGHYHSITGLARFLERNDPGGMMLSGFFAVRPVVGP